MPTSKTHLARRLSLALALGAGACALPRHDGPEHGGSQLLPPGSQQSPPETIARFEDARSDGEGLLQTFLRRGEPKTRERAAEALGRLSAADFGAPVTDALCAALSDESAAVRAAAAFALGERGDKSAAGALLAHARDADALVRARIVEAGSRIDDPRLRSLASDALDDPDPRVRSEAVLAPSRQPTTAPDAARVEGALIEFLGRTSGAAKPPPDADATWRGLFTLARRKSERARTLFLANAGSKDPRARIFALQGLGALQPDDATKRALRTGLSDRDWRVACEAAVALGKQPDAEALSDLAKAAENTSPHVRRCVYAALGGFASADEATRDAAKTLLERAHVDRSSNVRAAAIEARAKLLGEEMAPELELAVREKDPLVRAGAARAAAQLPARLAVPMLIQLSRDSNLRVAGVAIEGLARHATDESHARLVELLRAPDNGLRLDALEPLRAMATPDDLPALAECMAGSRGEISGEIAANVLANAAAIGGDRALEILKNGLEHRDPFVRRRARELIAGKFSDADGPRLAATTRGGTLPFPAEALATPKANPRVEVKTNRGTMVFELFADEAPLHVYSFLQLASRHFYDGLSFHRVEPDFVIQGGDARGDGNGGSSWRGDALREEFTPRKFARGSLGMPRNEDPDSGGSQIFVTHRETPHLDGRYTLFGELREGLDVLDAIEVGDTILAVRVQEPVGGR